MLNQSSHVWSSQFLGYPYGYGISVLPVMGLIGFLGSSGLGGEVLSKALLLAVVSISGLSSYRLLLEITQPRQDNQLASLHPVLTQLGSIVGGYFYAFSPFLFNELIGGAYTQFIAYSLAPLAILSFIRARADARGNWRNHVAAALLLSVVAMSLQYLVLVAAIMIAISVPALGRGLGSLAKILLLWLPLNSYWVFPLSYSLDLTLAAARAQTPSASILQNLQIHVPTVIQAFVGTGYFTDFFTATIPEWFYSTWVFVSIGLVSSCLVYLLARPSRPRVALWMTVLVISIIFETGSNSPFGGLVEWVFVNFPPMLLFKSPQHLIFPATLALAILLGLFSANILRRHTERLRIGVFVILVIAVSVWVSPFFSGNLGGNVDVYRLPSSYVNMNSIISHDGESGFRVLYMPMSGSPYYLNDDFQAENQGGDPTISYSQRPTIVSDLTPNPLSKEFATAMEGMLGGTTPPSNAAKLLSLVNVKYIILRNDVLPNFGPLVGDWNVTRVHGNLMRLDGVRLIATYPEASLWENDVPRAPLIYAATDAIYDDPPIYGIRDWQSMSGQWTAFQRYSIVGTNGVLRTNGVFVDTNLTVKTQLFPTAKSFDSWVLWRGHDINNYYYAGQTGVGYFTVGKVVGGQRTELYSWWMSYTTNQTLWIRVISQGSSFQILSGADGEQWIQLYNFEDGTFSTGFVGLKSVGMARFSNVTAGDPYNNVIFSDDFSRSNLVQLILSNRFVLGRTVVVPSNPGDQVVLDPYATANASQGDATRHPIQIASKGPFYLVDGESFDAGWILDAPGTIHIIADGWMNSWVINAGMSLQASLFYGPQRIFQYGIVVSVLALAATVTLLIGDGFISRRISGLFRGLFLRHSNSISCHRTMTEAQIPPDG